MIITQLSEKNTSKINSNEVDEESSGPIVQSK